MKPTTTQVYTEAQLAQWTRQALEGHAVRITGNLQLMLASKAKLIFTILQIQQKEIAQ